MSVLALTNTINGFYDEGYHYVLRGFLQDGEMGMTLRAQASFR